MQPVGGDKRAVPLGLVLSYRRVGVVKETVSVERGKSQLEKPVTISVVLIVGLCLIYLSSQSNEALKALLAALGGPLVGLSFGGLWSLFFEFQAVRRARQVFGRKMIKGNFTLVLPKLGLNQRAATLLADAGIDSPFSNRHQLHPQEEGVQCLELVAADDMHAAICVSQCLGKTTESLKIEDSGEWSIWRNDPRISIGMFSNACTLQFLDHHSIPGLCLQRDSAEKWESAFLACTVDGKEMACSQSSTQDFGVIIRHYPEPNDLDLVWLYVAGLGAEGTRGAAEYLSHHFPSITKDAQVGKDFTILLKVEKHHSNPISVVLQDYDSRWAKQGSRVSS